MLAEERPRTHLAVAIVSAIIIVNAFLFFLSRDQTFVHIDAIAHVNKARGLFDNIQPGLRQLGTVWLPLPHLLMAPLAAVDPLWRSGAAGSLLSVVCFKIGRASCRERGGVSGGEGVLKRAEWWSR